MKKALTLLIGMALIACSEKKETGQFVLVENADGPTLGYSPKSGVKILEIDGLKFKDLNKNGKLDPYEDWRLPVDERAKDLASKMSIEQIAGLMLYSAHQSIPAAAEGFGAVTYDGKPITAGDIESSSLTDQQKRFLKEDNLRHILITSVESPRVAAEWSNNMQAFVEGIGLGIPGNTSSDPRHAATASAEFNAGAGGDISQWPDGLALAATFDPDLVKQFAEIASREYRALGIGTALSPQVDLATEPRWYRSAYTFGESPKLSIDLTRAYIDGFQTSTGEAEIADGWGYNSVNAMVKHWPGGGTGEAGRDGHWAFGKFGVYPGNNFNQQLEPFVLGALELDGPTKQASAVMPYYTISYNIAPDSTNLANGYSKWIVTDLLRTKYGYDGVLCTDWNITHNEPDSPGDFAGKPWGVEDKTIDERHYIAIMAGMDQFGGNNDKGPVIAAYHMGVKNHGKEFMRARFEQSAFRLLRNIFRLGLFENPYLDPEESVAIVGNPEYMKAGFDAQLKSIVMLKNKGNVLPIKDKKTVYVPKVTIPAIQDWWGNVSETTIDYPVNIGIIEKYYNVTDDPSQADFALVFVRSPHNNADGGGYSKEDREAGGNGYVPISLQYRPYTAVDAREHSIAAGDPVVDSTITNRSYKGKTSTVLNTKDLDTILDTKNAMNGKPVIVAINADRPMIFSEFEQEVDAILLRFNVSEQAVMEIVSGKAEPSALLPIQMPANMTTVELQDEDVPFDMECYVDSEGHIYDFGYGLNWNGVIQDARTREYVDQR